MQISLVAAGSRIANGLRAPAARVGIIACTALVVPGTATAQEAAPGAGQLAIEPRIGWWWGRRLDSTGSGAGRFMGLRVSRAVAGRLHVVTSVGRAHLDHALTDTLESPDGEIVTVTRGHDYLPVTAGLELEVFGGRTRVSVALEAGAALYRFPVTSRTGPPPILLADEGSRHWNAEFAVLPGITIRHAFLPRLGGSVNVQSFNNLSSFGRGAWLEEPVVSFGVRWAIR